MKAKLQQLISLSSYDTVERMYRNGHIDQNTWEAYVRVWIWSAFRFSNLAGAGWRQDLFWKRYGKQAFYDRINKTRAAFGFLPISSDQPHQSAFHA